MESTRISVLQTLAWFDIFDFPLTGEELYKHLWQGNNSSYVDFLEVLDEMESEKKIKRVHGYYTPVDRIGLVEKRNRSIALIEQKMQIAKRAAKAICWIPFVEAIFLCNTVAFGWPKKESDIDFFIVIRKGRLWLTRFLVTVVLSVRGLRRNKKSIKDKICLSFYVTDDALNIKDIALDDQDIYLVYWLRFLVPLYISEDGIDAPLYANFWISYFIPHIDEVNTLHRYIAMHGKIGSLFKRMHTKLWGGSYGDLLEAQAKKIQQIKMKRNIESVQNIGDNRVVISDQRLKFHENDRRALYKQMWTERYKSIISSL